MRMTWTRAALALVGLGVLAALWGTLVEPSLLFTRRVTIAHPDWRCPTLELAVVSDIHVGAPHVTLDRLEEIVARINALEADLVLLLGDYVSAQVLFRRDVAPEPVAEGLARLAAPLGVIGVLGNHDWWSGGPRVKAALAGAGITVLENEAVRLDAPCGPLWVAGLADAMTRAPDPAAALAGIPASDPVIVIAHSPASFPDVPERALVTLAGHTHGGQVYLPFIGALTIPGRVPLRYAYGLVREEGRTMYVTGGIGTSIRPVRFNMPPEIVSIALGSPADVEEQ